MSQQTKSKIIPLIGILRRANWTITPYMFNARNHACMNIRVHGTGMDVDMCDEMFESLIGSIEKAKMISRDPSTYEEIETIEKNLRKLSQIQ